MFNIRVSRQQFARQYGVRLYIVNTSYLMMDIRRRNHAVSPMIFFRKPPTLFNYLYIILDA